MNQNVKVQIVQSVTRVRGVTPTGPMGPAGPKGDKGDKGDPGPPGADGADGADGVVQAIVAGSGILVDSSDPAAPEISLDTITAGQIVVDDDVFVNIAGEDLATVLADIDTQIASGGGGGGGGGGITVEDALDAVGNALVEGDNISIAVDDGNDTITIGVTGLTAEDIEFTPTAPWEAENVQEGIEELQNKASIVDLQVINLNSAIVNKQDADVLLSDIANLSDPGADRLLFWDDSADEITWLTLGSNLSITGTTLNASGGGGGGAVDSVNGQTGDVTLTYEDVGAAPEVHGHEIEDVDGLDTALAGKANSSHTHSTSDITSLAEFIRDTIGTALVAGSNVTITPDDPNDTITISVSGLDVSDISGLSAALAGKADAAHGHVVSDVTGLQDALDGKAAAGHGHDISDVTGLQTALDGKAASSHTHTASDVTDFAAATRAVTAVHVINAQTGTSYTAVATDAGKIVTLDNSSPITFTIPPNSSVAFAVGTRIDLIQTGEGQVTITPGPGVTVNGTPGTKLRAQHSAASVVKVATDTWQAIGDLAA